MENKEKNKEELNEILLTNYNYKIKSKGIEENIIAAANTQISIYTNLLKGSTLNGKH